MFLDFDLMGAVWLNNYRSNIIFLILDLMEVDQIDNYYYNRDVLDL
jgi:hypothetical protein